MEGQIEGEVTPYHSGDSNHNWRIELVELLRVIQFYNIGAIHVLQGTEMDMLLFLMVLITASIILRIIILADFKINIYEILRLIQLFNSYNGYYHVDPTTEDGFAPGLT